MEKYIETISTDFIRLKIISMYFLVFSEWYMYFY